MFVSPRDFCAGMMISIREERPEDIPAVRQINALAFGRPEEANLVDTLRRASGDVLSLVAVDRNEIVGHILFSPVSVDGRDGMVCGMGLAPMAVLPGRQRQGIGSVLVEHGLAILRERRCPFVVVLGHPAYYPRFGFKPASRYGLKSQWEGVPDEAFMAVVFDHDAMKDGHGVARYHGAFDQAV